MLLNGIGFVLKKIVTCDFNKGKSVLSTINK